MSLSGLNYTLKFATEVLCRFTQSFLRHFGPYCHERALLSLRNKDEGRLPCLDMAAHTMMKGGFWHMKTLLLESEMSAKDFAKTWSFCWLQIASTVNNFSSEKMILSLSVHAFNLLKKIFARSSLFSFWRSVRC